MLKFEEETKRILNACLEVHNELGCGFLEPVYQEALEREFRIQKIPFEREKLLPILYKIKGRNWTKIILLILFVLMKLYWK